MTEPMNRLVRFTTRDKPDGFYMHAEHEGMTDMPTEARRYTAAQAAFLMRSTKKPSADDRRLNFKMEVVVLTTLDALR